MAIVINGSGTVTGLSVGGLPDGTVDNDTLAGSIADGKITGLSSSKLSGALPAISAASLTNIPAANITGTMPAIDGSALTGIDGGKILQVKYAYWYPTSHHTITNSGTLTDLNITITPTASNSRFLSFITLGMLRQNGSDKYTEVRYYRDSTVIDGGGFGLGYSNYIGTYMNYNYKPHSYTFMHQETTGSGSRVYKIGTGTDSSWVVHQSAANAHIIMEIAG